VETRVSFGDCAAGRITFQQGGAALQGRRIALPVTPLRFANVALWSSASDEDRARVGMHAERGPESFDLSFRMIAGHDRFHLAQARRSLEAVSRG